MLCFAVGDHTNLLLEYLYRGYDRGEVYMHNGQQTVLLYRGGAAKVVYQTLRQFMEERREVGFGEFYEQQTSSGLQLREKRR
jgi:hypothetical protein